MQYSLYTGKRKRKRKRRAWIHTDRYMYSTTQIDVQYSPVPLTVLYIQYAADMQGAIPVGYIPYTPYIPYKANDTIDRRNRRTRYFPIFGAIAAVDDVCTVICIIAHDRE